MEGEIGREVDIERRVGRRLRWLWGGLGGWVVLGLVVAVVRGMGEGGEGGKVQVGREGVRLREVMVGGNTSLDGVLNASMKDIPLVGEGGQKFEGPTTNTVTSATPKGSSVDAEATLRLFDEL